MLLIWRVGVWWRLEGHFAMTIPVVEVARGKVCRAPVARAGLAGLFAAGMAAQILAETTRATRQPAPATLRLRGGGMGGAIGSAAFSAIGGGSETAEQSAGVSWGSRRVIATERPGAQTA